MMLSCWCRLVVLPPVVFMALTCLPGCQRKASEDNPIELGAILPLTGDAASFGLKARRGIELAVDEANDDGGVLGRLVTVDFKDDRNDAKEAVAIAAEFAKHGKVPVIFGAAASNISRAIAPVAEQNKLVLMSSLSSASELSTEGGPYFFRTMPSDEMQAEVLASWAHESGAGGAAIVYVDNDWGRSLARKFAGTFTSLGGSVVVSKAASEDTTDFRTVIAGLKHHRGMDVTVSWFGPRQGGMFVLQQKRLGWCRSSLGGHGWSSSEFRRAAGAAAEGVYFVAPSGITTRQYQGFQERYEAKYGARPDVLAAYSYDAANAVIKAIESCRATDGERIREALSRLSFDGVSGPIAFDANGDVQAELFGRFTIIDGEVERVRP